MITLQSPKVYSLPFSRKNRTHTFNNLICIKPMESGFFFSKRSNYNKRTVFVPREVLCFEILL